jgi:hypothetical protein
MCIITYPFGKKKKMAGKNHDRKWRAKTMTDNAAHNLCRNCFCIWCPRSQEKTKQILWSFTGYIPHFVVLTKLAPHASLIVEGFAVVICSSRET